MTLVGGCGHGSGGRIKLLNDGGGGGDGGLKLLNDNGDGRGNGSGGRNLLNDGSDAGSDKSLLLFLLNLRLSFLMHQTFFIKRHLPMVAVLYLQDHL